MNAADFASIIVALIAAGGAWAAQRSASHANRINSTVSGRLEAEREAYERARKFDIQTIERQRIQLDEAHEVIEELRGDLKKVKRRLAKIEELYPEWERFLHEQYHNDGD